MVTTIIPQTENHFVLVEWLNSLDRFLEIAHCKRENALTWGDLQNEQNEHKPMKTNQLRMNNNPCESHSFSLNESSSVQKMARGVLYLFVLAR